MTKEQVEAKIKEILGKDPRFRGAVVKIDFTEKKKKEENQ